MEQRAGTEEGAAAATETHVRMAETLRVAEITMAELTAQNKALRHRVEALEHARHDAWIRLFKGRSFSLQFARTHLLVREILLRK